MSRPLLIRDHHGQGASGSPLSSPFSKSRRKKKTALTVSLLSFLFLIASVWNRSASFPTQVQMNEQQKQQQQQHQNVRQSGISTGTRRVETLDNTTSTNPTGSTLISTSTAGTSTTNPLPTTVQAQAQSYNDAHKKNVHVHNVHKNVVPKKYTISLVTSFFANALIQTDPHPHLAEVMISMLSNLHNPHFDQVVIVLDGSSSDANCTTFQHKMNTLQSQFLTWRDGSNNININSNNNNLPETLSCVDRSQGQPNYYEMFQYATDPTIVTSEVVVMANADQAFDDSLQWANHLKETSVLTLPTWGYNRQQAPAQITTYLEYLHGTNLTSSLKLQNRCNSTVKSWDAYVFHQSLLQGKLRAESFKRDTHKGQRAFFNMNEIGAENAALWSLLENVPRAQPADGCNVLQTWHFHAAPKMHTQHNNKNEFWKGKPGKRYKVPRPNRRPEHSYDTAFESLPTVLKPGGSEAPRVGKQ